MIANDFVEMQHTLNELTQNTQDAKFMWKEGEIMARGDLVDEKGDIIDDTDTITDIYTWIADKDNPTQCNYEKLPSKVEIILLGTKLHFTGNSTRSMEHRLAKAENAFCKHYTTLKKQKPNVKHKLNLWIGTVLKSATYECGPLYMDEKMIHKLRSWELRFLRKLLPVPHEQDISLYYQAAAIYLDGITAKCNTPHLVHLMLEEILRRNHRILRHRDDDNRNRNQQ